MSWIQCRSQRRFQCWVSGQRGGRRRTNTDRTQTQTRTQQLHMTHHTRRKICQIRLGFSHKRKARGSSHKKILLFCYHTTRTTEKRGRSEWSVNWLWRRWPLVLLALLANIVTQLHAQICVAQFWLQPFNSWL